MLQTNKSELLKKVFCGLSTFNEDIIFRINKDHIYFGLMTDDNTSFIIVKIPSICFQKYEFKKIEDIKINGALIRQILSKVSKDDVIFISFGDYFDIEKSKNIDSHKEETEKQTEKLSQMQITLSSTKYKKTYQIPLIEINEDDGFKSNEPQLEHKIKVRCNNKDIKEMLDSLIFTGIKGLGDSINLVTDGTKIDFKEDTKLGKSMLTLKDFDKSGLKQKISIKISYNLLKPLIIFQSSLSDNSDYYFKEQYPLKIHSKTDECEVITILAPRVENED